MTELERMLTVKETAEQLNVTQKTVYNLIERNELKAYKVGNRWRITPEDINRYLGKAD